MVESATFCKVGSPAQTNNNDNASANAARCRDNGAQSEASKIVLHRLTTTIGTPPYPARNSEYFSWNIDSLRRGPMFSKVGCAKFPKTVTASEDMPRFYDFPDGNGIIHLRTTGPI